MSAKIMNLVHKNDIVYSVEFTQIRQNGGYELAIAVHGLGDPPTPARKEILVKHLEIAISRLKEGLDI